MPLQSQTLTGDLSGAGQFVGWPSPNQQRMGVDDNYGVSVTGQWTGLMLLQRSLDGGTTWGTLDQSTANIEWGGSVGCGCLLRTGFDPNTPVTGTAHVIQKVGQ